MLMSPMRDGTGRTTSEDRATQLLICEPLSFAIWMLKCCFEISVMLVFVLFCCCQWGLCNVLNVCNVCSTAVEAFSLILLLTSKTLQSGANREVKNTNKD